MTNIDFIGEIHGHVDKLEQLLTQMEYKADGKGFKHSSEKALFVGDCNHEFNAVCFNRLTSQGYVRPQSIKNYKLHSETLLQYHGKEALKII